MADNVVPNGTVVHYHGAQESKHGVMTVEGVRDTSSCRCSHNYIYTLRYGPGDGETLNNVLRESFTID